MISAHVTRCTLILYPVSDEIYPDKFYVFAVTSTRWRRSHRVGALFDRISIVPAGGRPIQLLFRLFEAGKCECLKS
jgi:hypothetical protein